MDAVTIRRATLADLPLLLRYRRAMAEEMETPDPLAVNRMITALEPYLRSAIPEGRWHAWIAEPGHDVHGFTASISNPRFGAAVSGGDLPRPWWGGVANRGCGGSICTPANKVGPYMNRSVSSRPLKCASNCNGG